MSNQPHNADGLIIIEGSPELLVAAVDLIRNGDALTPALIDLPDQGALILLDEMGLPTIHFKAPMKPKAFQHAPLIRVDLQYYHYPVEGHVVRVRVMVHDDARHPYGF